MKTIHRILLLLNDRLGHTAAVERAVALSKAFKAELWLCLHDRGPRLGMLGIMDPSQARRLEDMMRSQRSERLADLRQNLLDEGVPAVHLIDDRVRLSAACVTQDVATYGIDLVIKDVGHPSLLRRLVLLPFEWSLLRECPVPVWLVGPHVDHGVPRRIVAAIDPVQPEHGAGRLNEALLETSRMLVEASQGRLQIFSAFVGISPALQALDPMGMSMNLSSADLYESLRVDHRRALEALMREHRLPMEAATVLYGPPASTLLDAIEDFRPEVLVVGTLQRHGFDRFFMGSTVERLIGEASCDVLTVPAVAAQEPCAAREKPVAAETTSPSP
jgi:universal stress protein E